MHMHVYSAIYGQEECIGCILGYPVACADCFHIHPVAYNEPVESVFIPHNVGHQPFVCMTWDPIQFVMCWHKGKRFGFLYGCFEWG